VCGRTSPFISPRTRSSAIVDPQSRIRNRHRLYPIQDGYVRGSLISAPLGYPGMIRERRASKIPRISAVIRELISTCPPHRSIHVVDISCYEHFSCRLLCRKREEGKERKRERVNRVLRASIISHRSPFKRDIGKDQREVATTHRPHLLDNPSRS